MIGHIKADFRATPLLQAGLWPLQVGVASFLCPLDVSSFDERISAGPAILVTPGFLVNYFSISQCVIREVTQAQAHLLDFLLIPGLILSSPYPATSLPSLST